MGIARRLLVLCSLTWVHCMVQLYAEILEASAYTDCTSDTNSTLIVTGVFLTPSSPYPNDLIFLTFNVSNPSTTKVTVGEIDSTLSFGITTLEFEEFNQSIVVSSGAANITLTTTSITQGQFYTIGLIPFQIVLYSSLNTVLACWEGNVNVSAPLALTDELPDGSQLNVTALALHPSQPSFNTSFYLTFEIENEGSKNVNFSTIVWTITFNAGTPLGQTTVLPLPISLAAGETQDLNTTSIVQTQSVIPSWFVYTLQFLSNEDAIASWKGWGTIPSSPYSPSDCLIGGSELSLSNVTLDPSSPHINQPFYLIFEVENESDGNVAFNNVTWTLVFNESSPITNSFDLTNTIVEAGQRYNLTGNSVTLNESVGAGTYPYQLELFEDTTLIMCWFGGLVVPSYSSYIYFLGLAGMSIMLMS